MQYYARNGLLQMMRHALAAILALFMCVLPATNAMEKAPLIIAHRQVLGSGGVQMTNTASQNASA